MTSLTRYKENLRDEEWHTEPEGKKDTGKGMSTE